MSKIKNRVDRFPKFLNHVSKNILLSLYIRFSSSQTENQRFHKTKTAKLNKFENLKVRYFTVTFSKLF